MNRLPSIERPEQEPQLSVATILKEGSIGNRLPLQGGANEIILYEIDGTRYKGVFKPNDGAIELRLHVQPETHDKREVAASLVDSLLDFNLIPPTVIREINNRQGSFQQFIEDATPACLYSKDVDSDQLVTLAVLDYIIWNSDRSKANYLVRNSSELIAIDNSLTFGRDNADFSPLYNSTIPEAIIRKLIAFVDSDNGPILTSLLEGLLDPAEVEACVARIKKIADLAQQGPINEAAFDQLQYNPDNPSITAGSLKPETRSTQDLTTRDSLVTN